MGAEGKYDLRLVGTGLESESSTKNKNGSGVLTGRKSSSTPSLPDCTDVGMRGSVASTDQAASADNLAAKVRITRNFFNVIIKKSQINARRVIFWKMWQIFGSNINELLFFLTDQFNR